MEAQSIQPLKLACWALNVWKHLIPPWSAYVGAKLLVHFQPQLMYNGHTCHTRDLNLGREKNNFSSKISKLYYLLRFRNKRRIESSKETYAIHQKECNYDTSILTNMIYSMIFKIIRNEKKNLCCLSKITQQ